MKQLLLFALVLLPALARAEPTLPDPYAGKMPAIMSLLYPKWEQNGGRTGVVVEDKTQWAKLHDATLWEVKGRKVLALLVQTWAGDPCTKAPCPATPFDVAAVEWTGNKLVLVGMARGAFEATDPKTVAFEPAVPLIERASSFLGVRSERDQEGRALTRLRLLALEKAGLKLVFDRVVRDAKAGQKAVDAGCLATLSTDDLEAAPYPIKVTERCQQTKRTSVEFWRWQGSEYRLHGPASNAAEEDLLEDENDL